jgi:Protein of unknown function (DUF2892)
MKKNMGSTDRSIRVGLAVLMMTLYYTNVVSGTFGTVLIILSIVFWVTSFISFCPLYSIAGINTCNAKS